MLLFLHAVVSGFGFSIEEDTDRREQKIADYACVWFCTYRTYSTYQRCWDDDMRKRSIPLGFTIYILAKPTDVLFAYSM